MSGIYIPNIKPPTACCACPCSYDNQCAVNNEYPTFAEWYEDKPKWCPLIPVPDHGRLIDADALIEDLERQCKEVFRIDAVSPDDYWITRNEAYNEALWKSWVESFGEYLKTRPTIIPAEEGQ